MFEKVFEDQLEPKLGHGLGQTHFRKCGLPHRLGPTDSNKDKIKTSDSEGKVHTSDPISDSGADSDGCSLSIVDD